MTASEIRPLLRGWLHLVCAILTVPAALALYVHAESGEARAAAVVYGIGVFLMFGVSAAYHRGRWSPSVRPWMRRADHGAIFVMIAGSYTPLCLVALSSPWGERLLTVVWVAATIGVVGALTGIAERRIVGLVAYIGLGWVSVLALPQLWSRLSGAALVLLFLGGILYTAGSIGLGLRWPRGWPATFGYHEIWHVMVTVAVICHYATVWSVLR